MQIQTLHQVLKISNKSMDYRMNEIGAGLFTSLEELK